jgi:hypothetical protein
MKDIQKIKEFFSKPLNEESTTFKVGDKVTYLGHPAEITKVNKEMTGGITYNVYYDKGTGKTKATNLSNKGGEIKSLNEGNHNAEDFKPYVVKDNNNPNFLKIFIQYPTGTGFTTALGQRTMTGQDREYGADKAMKIGQAVAAKLDSKYNLEDIDVSDNEAGKVIVFAVSDDFIKMNTPSLDEAKKETAVDMAKKQLDALGVKYELGDKFRPFKAIYKPTDMTDDWYDDFDEIIYLFNLGSAVKRAMNEAQEQSLYKDWDQFEKPSKIKVYLNSGKTLEITPLKLKGGKRVYDAILQAFIDDRFDITNKVIQGMTNNLSEAKEEDKVDTITMDVPLFIRMLEYSREDAAADVDLHDVTEKANKLGKERGILQMEDYDEIVGATEEIKEGELTEANIPSNIRDFAKRKGVLPLVNKVAKWAEAVGARIAGGTAIGKNYSTLVLDLDYKQQGEIRIDTDNETITLFDEPVRSYNEFQRVYSDGQGNNLEEALVKKVISKIREAKSTPCWKGYEQKGMKEKNGKQVPNCVPKK